MFVITILDNIWQYLELLAIHITNQKLSFDIFTVGNLQNILIEHSFDLIS